MFIEKFRAARPLHESLVPCAAAARKQRDLGKLRTPTQLLQTGVGTQYPSAILLELLAILSSSDLPVHGLGIETQCFSPAASGASFQLGDLEETAGVR